MVQVEAVIRSTLASDMIRMNQFVTMVQVEAVVRSMLASDIYEWICHYVVHIKIELYIFKRTEIKGNKHSRIQLNALLYSIFRRIPINCTSIFKAILKQGLSLKEWELYFGSPPTKEIENTEVISLKCLPCRDYHHCISHTLENKDMENNYILWIKIL